MITPYLIGLLFYCLSVWLSYNESAKASSWYFPVGIAFAIVCNFLWLYIAKHSETKHAIYMNGLLWDSMIVGIYTVVPVLLFNVRFAPINLIGVVMVVTGMILTKV